MSRRPVYLVHEPVKSDSAVPWVMQEWVGFSHVKLVVLTRSKIKDHNAQGKVYDVWKDGKNDIGFGSFDSGGKAVGIAWDGLKEDEEWEEIGETSATNEQILKADTKKAIWNQANDVIKEMKNYNVITKNCQIFSLKLGEAITKDAGLSTSWYKVFIDNYFKNWKPYGSDATAWEHVYGEDDKKGRG